MATFRVKRKRNERVDPSSIMHHLCFFCGEMFTVLSDYQRHLVDHQMIGISHQLYLEEIATKKKQRKNRLQSAAAPINGRRHTIATTAPNANDAPMEVKDKQRDVRPLDRAESKSRHTKDRQPNKDEYYADSMDIDPAPQVEQQQPSRRAHSKLAEPQPVMSKESQNPSTTVLSTGNAETLKPPSSASSRASQSPQTTEALVSKPEKEKPQKPSPPLHTTSKAADLAGSSVNKSAVMSEPAKVANSSPPASTSGPSGNQQLPVPAPAPASSYYFAPPTLPQHSAPDPVRPGATRCEQCQSEFDKKTQLVQHLVNMHGWDVDSMMLSPFSGAESRDPRAVREEEVCVECTLEFNTPTRFFLHLLLVHKESLFYEDNWTKILLDIHLRKATSTMVVELSLTLSTA